MTAKRTELEKRKGLKIANALKAGGAPARVDPADDRKARREQARALGLVPLAVKVPQPLLRAAQERAAQRGQTLDAVVQAALQAVLDR